MLRYALAALIILMMTSQLVSIGISIWLAL